MANSSSLLRFGFAGQSEEQIDGGGGVRPIAVGADLVGKHLADGSAADGHFDLTTAGCLEAVDDGFHVGHGCRQQRAHTDDRGVAFVRSSHEFLDALIDADVVNLEAGPFGHHADEVLSNVMQVAANGAHEEHAGALRVAVAGAQKWLEHRHAGFHGAGGDENFRDVEDVVLEIFADYAHARNQAFRHYFLNLTPFGQSVLGHLLDLRGFAFVKALIHEGVIGHGRSQGQGSGEFRSAGWPTASGEHPIRHPLQTVSDRSESFGVEFVEGVEHRDDVFTRHAGTGPAADGKDHSLAATSFEDVECRFADFFRRTADGDFQRIHVAHQAHAVRRRVA